MPMSRPDTIEATIRVILARKPMRVLDVGCGDGFYGFIFRRYLDADERLKCWMYTKQKWTHRIDAIEIFEDYLNPIHDFVYDMIYKEDARLFFQKVHLSKYDCIFFGDIIEHLSKADALTIIDSARHQLNDGGFIIISTPLDKMQWEKSPNENPLEAHISRWDFDDLAHPAFVNNYTIQASKIGKNLFAVLTKAIKS